VDDRPAVVDARNVGGREHGDHAGRRAHRVEFIDTIACGFADRPSAACSVPATSGMSSV
jgi:hypothetical protein